MKKYVSKDKIENDFTDVSVTSKQEYTDLITKSEKEQNHNNQKISLQDQLDVLNEKKISINRELTNTKNKIQNLKRPSNDFDCSDKQISRRLEAAEHRLRTADISKRQESQLNSRILELKRILPKARPEIEIRSEINKLKNLEEILTEQIKEVKEEIKEKSKPNTQAKSKVNQINKQKDNSQIVDKTQSKQQAGSKFEKNINPEKGTKIAISHKK